MKRVLILIPLLCVFHLGCDSDDAGVAASDFGVDAGNPDRDDDGVTNGTDNCPDVSNADQADLDEDGQGDACDVDDDGDGVLDEADGCPMLADPLREDADGDGIGDLCDDDDDNDGITDDVDLCPKDPTDMGADVDGDGLGDPCDFDIDGDEVRNEDDNCPTVANTAQEDMDEDGLGDGCDDDRDGDEIADVDDNCPNLVNPEQADLDFDSVGDACDEEADGDGILDVMDNCPVDINPDQADEDMDGVGDACDACPRDPENDLDRDAVCGDVDNCPTAGNPEQVDDDEDGLGTACDPCPFDVLNDDDGDLVCGSLDNCVDVANPEQEDGDRDGLGDACDLCPADADNDHDQDGVCGDIDLCPLAADPDQLDSDEDGLGDACDICPGDPANDADADSVCGDVDNCPDFPNVAQADDDGDGIGDACDDCVAGGRIDPDGDARCGVADNCPATANADQLDTDDDGLGDLCDVCPGDALNDIDGDGICGDLDTCPEVYDPGQANDDGDGDGNACDLDADNDGVPDSDDNCPLTENPDQRDRYGDERGDACEFVYFYDDFELGLERWDLERGVWAVSEEAARSGLWGLVDQPGRSLARTWSAIHTPVLDLTLAERPRVSFYGRFSLRDNGFTVKVLDPDGVELKRVVVVGPGDSGQDFQRFEVDIREFVGRNDVRVSLQFSTGRNPGLGVWIDDFRVDEAPVLPAHVLPVQDGFETLDQWDEIGGDWSTSIHGAWSDSALQFASVETIQQGVATLKLRRPVDFRGAAHPQLSFWMRSSDFDVNTGLVVEVRPIDGDLDPMFWTPRPGAANPYYERFVLPLDQFAGNARVEILLHYNHMTDRRSWATLDDLRIEERPAVAERTMPVDIWVPDDLIRYETGGWGVVEEPIGLPALRSSAFGLEPNSETRASLGLFDFTDAVNPQASIWVRYALRADRQSFVVLARGEAFLERFVVLEARGQDLINGQFQRIDVDLSPLNGNRDLELILVVTNGNEGYFGVDVSRILVGESESLDSVSAPVRFDFDEASPDLETVSGRWGVSETAGVEGTGAIRLVSRLGIRGNAVVDHVRLLPPIDLSSLDRPQLSLALRHYNNALHHELRVLIRTADRGTWDWLLSRNGGTRSQVRSDGFQQHVIPLDAVAGSTAATIELYAVTRGEEPLDVAFDDLVVDSAPANPPARLSIDGNNFYQVFINGDEVGAGARWLAGESFSFPVQIGVNAIAIEVDGPGDGPRVISALQFGSLLVRSGESGWKSSMINPDGSFEQGWMNLGFEDGAWANVSTAGALPLAVSNAPYLGLDDTLGAKFMAHTENGPRQYFRKTFTVNDRDADLVPDAVDLCPDDPTGPEPDRNGNGQGDSCDLCADCRNVAYGKSVTASGVQGNNQTVFGPWRVTNGAPRCDRWRSGQDTGWVEVDLGSRHRVCSARVYNSTDCGAYTAGMQAWHLTVRDEAGDEIEVGRGDNGNRLPASTPETVDFEDCHPARYVRLYVDRGRSGQAAVSELQVFGEPMGE